MNPRKIESPFNEEAVRALKIGEPVLLCGTLFTGRDRLHKYISEGGRLPVSLRDGAIYHCGPVMIAQDGGWRVRAAGPTTSSREDIYMAAVIEKTGLRVIIGKGGMGPATIAACAKFGCVYLQATGGAAQVLAAKVESVKTGHFVENFGMAEAMWEMQVRDFPAVVAIDAAGHGLFPRIEAESRQIRDRLVGRQS